MFFRTVMSLGIIALVAAVISCAAPAADETAGTEAAGAQEEVPIDQLNRMRANEATVPLEAPDETPRMQRPATPEPNFVPGSSNIDDLGGQMQLDVLEAPENVPLMQKPLPPSAQPVREHEAVAEGRILVAAVTPVVTLAKGEGAFLTLQFSDQQGNPVTSDTLLESHTKKVHILIIDESLVDFHHVHPAAAEASGKFTFSFTPQTGHNYALYADVWPVGGERQVVSAPLRGASPCEADCVDRSAGGAAEAGDIKAVAAFDAPPLKQGEPQRGTIILTGADGKPLENLEPVLGAFAHIAGFYEGFGGVAHVHPERDEPKDENARAASPLSFMLHPEAPGYLKYFVQVRVGGKDVFLPFGANIEP